MHVDRIDFIFLSWNAPPVVIINQYRLIYGMNKMQFEVHLT